MGCSGDLFLGMYCSFLLLLYLEEDYMGDIENIRDIVYYLFKLYFERIYVFESFFNFRFLIVNYMDYRLRFVGEILD